MNCEHATTYALPVPEVRVVDGQQQTDIRQIRNGDKPVATIELRWCRDCQAIIGRPKRPK